MDIVIDPHLLWNVILTVVVVPVGWMIRASLQNKRE